MLVEKTGLCGREDPALCAMLPLVNITFLKMTPVLKRLPTPGLGYVLINVLQVVAQFKSKSWLVGKYGESEDLLDKFYLILFLSNWFDNFTYFFSWCWTLVCDKLIPYQNGRIRNAKGDFICD